MWLSQAGRFIYSICLKISRRPVKCSDSQMTPDCESVHHNFIITTCYFCDMTAAVSCWLLKLIWFYWRRIFWAMNPTNVSSLLLLIWIRFSLRCWRLWTFFGCLCWHASSVRHGGLYTRVAVSIFKGGGRECAPIIRDHTAQPPRVLERRLGSIKPQIQEEQYRFCPGHGSVNQLFTHAGLLEGSWEFAHPVYMSLLDLWKVYERVPWGVLLRGGTGAIATSPLVPL